MSKPESTAVISIEELMRKQVAENAGRFSTSGSTKISVSDKKFTFPDKTEIKGKPIEVVIIDYINTNTLYNGPYKPGNVTPPLCAAVGREEATMVPRASIEDPVSPTCAVCPKNAWGSGSGNGKACSNKILMVVAKPDDITGELYTIEASATAIKDFAKYINKLGVAETTCWGVITSISFSDDSFPSLRFQPSAKCTNEQALAAYGRQEEAFKMLVA